MTNDPYRIHLHRDGTITVFDVFAQQWTRTDDLTPEQMSTLTSHERVRVARHFAKPRRVEVSE